MTADVAVVILAAGLGTRMRSALPKVLHRVGGLPMLEHCLRAARAVPGVNRVYVVARPGMEEALTPFLSEDTRIVFQERQLGTADAVKAAVLSPGFPESGTVLVMYADTPLIRPETLAELCRGVAEEITEARVAGFTPEDPTGYGRLIAGESTCHSGILPLERITEHKDANEAERAIRLCNSGVMALRAKGLTSRLARVDNRNAKQEYYLTDLIGIVRAEGASADCLTADAEEFLGVNSREELATAEAAFQRRERRKHMAAGVTLIDPGSVFFSADTRIAEDVIIEPGVFFGPGVSVARGARIMAYSHLEGAEIGEGCCVGPFARLRLGAVLEAKARAGNFVEVKNTRMGEGAKANHLAYLGDATVGEGANIGAGAVFCNYDGVRKHRTEIGAGAFVGSNCSLVAPVSVGAGAVTAAGSVVTKNVPEGSLAFGRARQTVKENYGGVRRKGEDHA